MKIMCDFGLCSLAFSCPKVSVHKWYGSALLYWNVVGMFKQFYSIDLCRQTTFWTHWGYWLF